MRIVVALGGNALLRRGEPLTADNQQANVAVACAHLAPLAGVHELVVSHGNGPQIGLLALEGAAYEAVPPYPLDVLGAETQGMVGYLLQRQLAGLVPHGRPVATLLTMIEVDPGDPAFGEPAKPIGPVYDAAEADELARTRGWAFRADGGGVRRVVPSPAPRRIVELDQIAALLGDGCVVVCAGGGGIPVARRADGGLAGVEAVIDKDAASALLARDLGADLLVMATDVDAAQLGFRGPVPTRIRAAHPDALLPSRAEEFASGSMGPKVAAACAFAAATGRTAVIGRLEDIEAMVDGTAGTRVSTDVDGLVLDAATGAG